MGWIIKLGSSAHFEHIEEHLHEKTNEKLILTEISYIYEYFVSKLADGEIPPTENPAILNNKKGFDPFSYVNGHEINYDMSPRQYLEILDDKGNFCNSEDDDVDLKLRERYIEIHKGFFKGISGLQKMYNLDGSEKEEITNISAFNYLSHVGFIFHKSRNIMHGELKVISTRQTPK